MPTMPSIATFQCLDKMNGFGSNSDGNVDELVSPLRIILIGSVGTSEDESLPAVPFVGACSWQSSGALYPSHPLLTRATADAKSAAPAICKMDRPPTARMTAAGVSTATRSPIDLPFAAVSLSFASSAA